jgi:hypothetical protein
MREPVDVASVVVFAATDDVAGSMNTVRVEAGSTLLAKPMRGATRVPPFILSAVVHYQGFRSLRLNFEGGYQCIVRARPSPRPAR